MQETQFYRRRLPHLRLAGATYFVTWRLARTQVPLRDDERTLVANTLSHFDGARYDLLAYVVMDDHVHAIVRPLERQTLEAVLHTWKSYTANRLQRTTERVGRIWQEEGFDRVIRDEVERAEKVRHVLSNPWKRWPGLADYPWTWARGM